MCMAITIEHVYIRSVSMYSLFLWLMSILLFIKAMIPINTPFYGKIHRQDAWTLSIIVAFGLLVLWYVGSIPSHYHQDEFITAHTSFTLPPIQTLDWFGVYPPVWVSQFPALFHIFQKPFFCCFPHLFRSYASQYGRIIPLFLRSATELI